MLETKTTSPRPVFEHVPHGGPRNVEYAEHVHVEHRAPVFRVSFGNGAVEAEPGVVYQDVQPTEVFYRAGDECGAVGGIRDVCRDGERSLTEFLGQLLQPVFAAGGQGDVASIFGEPAGGGFPNAAGGTGDDGGLVV